MTAETVRAFVCFEIDRQVAHYLGKLIAEGKQIDERIGWSKPEKIHLTLKFLGDIDGEQVTQVSRVLQQIAAQQAAFALTIDTLGAFPNFRRPRVFWAGASHVPPALTELVAALETALQQIGFEKEKRTYKPHLTLGRAKNERCAETAAFLKNKKIAPQKIHCAELVLMKSELQPTGAIYTPLAICKLQPGENV